MTTVITYGTFDLFHIGHLRLLSRAAALGDRLVVGISTDEFNLEKHKKCVHPYEERAAIVASLKMVDEVFAENSWDQKIEDVKRFQADVFLMGSDWEGKFDFLKDYCRVVYLPRTPSVSTTARKGLILTGAVSLSQWTARDGEMSGD